MALFVAVRILQAMTCPSPFMVISIVADSFAGERERHTLETLLASRLSDKGILFGKIVVAVAYGWGLTLISMLVGLATVNLAYGAGELMLYSADAILLTTTASLLIVALVSSVGVVISLRAPNVRQAQQTLSIGFLILLFGAIIGMQIIPVEWKAGLMMLLMKMGETNILIVGIAFLVLTDISLIVVTMSRFKRARLILD